MKPLFLNTLNYNLNTECVRDKSKKDINVEYENVSRENICCTVISFYLWFIKRERFTVFSIFQTQKYVKMNILQHRINDLKNYDVMNR